MDEMVIWHAADKCFTCQRQQRVTVLPLVSDCIPKPFLILHVNKAKGVLGSKKIPGGDCFH